MNHMLNYHDWRAVVNKDISDFGRDDSVQIMIGAYNGPGFDKFIGIEEIRSDGVTMRTYPLVEGEAAPFKKLKIPLEVAKALHDALNYYFQFAQVSPDHAALVEALKVERTRVDKVLDRVVPQALGSRT